MDRWDSVRAVKRTLCSFLSQFFVFAISSKFGIARTISPHFFRFRLSIFGQQFDKRFKNENIGRSEQMVNTDERRQFTCNLQKWESNDFFSVSSLSSISVAYFFFFGLAYFRSARPNVFLCFSFKYIPVLISKYTTHSIGDDGFFNSRFGAYVIILLLPLLPYFVASPSRSVIVCLSSYLRSIHSFLAKHAFNGHFGDSHRLLFFFLLASSLFRRIDVHIWNDLVILRGIAFALSICRHKRMYISKCAACPLFIQSRRLIAASARTHTHTHSVPIARVHVWR